MANGECQSARVRTVFTVDKIPTGSYSDREGMGQFMLPQAKGQGNKMVKAGVVNSGAIAGKMPPRARWSPRSGRP